MKRERGTLMRALASCRAAALPGAAQGGGGQQNGDGGGDWQARALALMRREVAARKQKCNHLVEVSPQVEGGLSPSTA